MLSQWISHKLQHQITLDRQSHTTAKDLYGVLVKLHENAHLASAFHLYQQMLNSTWDGISLISDHIAGIRTIDSQLTGMKYAINPRLLTFTLVNSLVNSIDKAKLTFDDMETQIVAEASRLNLSGNGPESGLNAKENPNSGDQWCDHHKIATHNTADCYSYQSWVKGLQEGKGKRGGKKGDKLNVTETPPDSSPPESVYVTSTFVSHDLTNQIHAYLSTEPDTWGKTTSLSTLVQHCTWPAIGHGSQHTTH